jgi:hypothetical protein
MTWKRTLILITVAALALIWVLGREGGDTRRGEARLAAGLLYPHEAEEVRTLEIAFPERTLRVERRESEGQSHWWLTAPVVDPGDSVVIDRLLATVAGEEVSRWLPPPGPGELAAYGLDAPRLELRLETDAGWDTLRFGELNEVEKKLWVQGSWRDSLALVSTLLRSHAMKGRYQLADKRPMGNLSKQSVESIRIRNRHGEFELVPSPRGWEILRPEAYRADDAAVTRMLDRFWGESIIDFAEGGSARDGSIGFETPRAVMSVKVKGETRPRLIELGGSSFGLQHLRSSERDHSFLLDSVSVKPMLESFSALLSTVLVNFMPGMVEEISDGEGFLARKADHESWRWEDPQGRELENRNLSILLTRLRRLDTGRVLALLPRQDQLRDWGLTPPQQTFTLLFEGGGKLTVELGKVIDGRRVLRRSDYPTVYSLPAAKLDLPWPPELAP